MTAQTPGQAAYEAFRRAFPDEDWGPWESLDGEGRSGWEDIARAVTAREWGRELPVVGGEFLYDGFVLLANGTGFEPLTRETWQKRRDAWCEKYNAYLRREHAAQQPLRDALAAEIEALEAEACTVHPSRLSEFKRAEAARLRQILEGQS